MVIHALCGIMNTGGGKLHSSKSGAAANKAMFSLLPVNNYPHRPSGRIVLSSKP